VFLPSSSLSLFCYPPTSPPPIYTFCFRNSHSLSFHFGIGPENESRLEGFNFQNVDKYSHIERHINLRLQRTKLLHLFLFACNTSMPQPVCHTILIVHYASPIVLAFSKFVTDSRKRENTHQAGTDHFGFVLECACLCFSNTHFEKWNLSGVPRKLAGKDMLAIFTGRLSNMGYITQCNN